jgi:hypothetical protein
VAVGYAVFVSPDAGAAQSRKSRPQARPAPAAPGVMPSLEPPGGAASSDPTSKPISFDRNPGARSANPDVPISLDRKAPDSGSPAKP